MCAATLIILVGCGSGSQTASEVEDRTVEEVPVVMPVDKGVSLIFYKLDDFAKIYVGDSLVLDTSEKYGMNPDHDVLLNLDEILIDGRQLIIEAHNSGCTDCNSNKWEIIYEIFMNGESIDYVSEDSNGQPSELGLMIKIKHELDKL